MIKQRILLSLKKSEFFNQVGHYFNLMIKYIFTEDFINSIKKPSENFERKYIYFLSTQDRLADRRDRLERIVNTYPNDKIDKIVARIKSEDDETSRSAIHELFVYEKLFKGFTNIEVEPNKSIFGNLTTDFFVDNSIIFEVTTKFEKTNPKYSEIYETINKINCNYIVSITNIQNLPKESLKLSEIENRFRKLFDSTLKSNLHNTFSLKTSQNVLIEGIIYYSKKEHSTVGSIMDGYEINELDSTNHAVRRSIIKKNSKYKPIVDKGFPLIVVIYNRSGYLTDEHWDEIIYGNIEFQIEPTSRRIINEIRKNALLQPSKNTSLSGILFRDYDGITEFAFVKNPYAKIRIDTIENKILTAFNARVID